MASDDEKKVCFVISPIGEDESDTRKRSDLVLRHIIRPAVEPFGYKAVRADEIDKPGLITSQVIQSVVNEPLVIADLTETNPNVFYELAIRHAFRKPLIQLIQKGEKIPFDVAGLRTIQFDHQDLDNVAETKEEIGRQIKQLELDESEIETPISVSLDLQQLRQSENPDDRNIAELIEAVSDIRSEIQNSFSKNEYLSEKLSEQTAKSIVRHLREDGGPRFFGPPGIRGPLPYRVFESMIMELPDNDDWLTLKIAIISSMFKDSAPWIYETGMEIYRHVTPGTSPRKRAEYFEKFDRAIDLMVQHPAISDAFRMNKYMERYLRFLEHIQIRLRHIR